MVEDCAYPFSHLYIEPRGTVGTCCAIHYQNSKYLIQSAEDLEAWGSHPELSNIRNHFRLHRKMHESCGQCIYHEKSKKTNFNADVERDDLVSMRENLNRKITKDELVNLYITPKIRSMHIKFGNLCNLACRTCSEESSNLLQKEFGIIYTTNKKVPIERFGDLNWYEKPGVFDKLLSYTKDIVEFHASGGEPLVNEYFWKLLKHCADNNYSKNITLGINTNGTVTLKEDQIKLIQSFKHVSFDVSQDATEDLSEYIRTRSSWKKFCSNINQYKEMVKHPGIRMRIVLTISVFNVHKIDQLVEFIKQENLEWFYQFVHFPKELNVVNLNDLAKQFLIDKYSATNLKFISDYLQTQKTENLKETTKAYIDRRDDKAQYLYKNFNIFKNLEPDWYNLL